MTTDPAILAYQMLASVHPNDLAKLKEFAAGLVRARQRMVVVVALAESGVTVKEIVRRLGVSAATVRNDMERYGRETGNPWARDELLGRRAHLRSRRLVAMRHDGIALSEMAQVEGLSVARVRQILREWDKVNSGGMKPGY